MVDKWLSSIDEGEVVGAIFYDLKKAFDIVNHELLIKKLDIYKFDMVTLNWMNSYLSGRKQCIVNKINPLCILSRLGSHKGLYWPSSFPFIC